jgi:hypothetical protein
MFETITAYFENQGLLGIVILMLIGVVVWQQKRIDAKDKQITDLQDKRIADTNSYTSSYTSTTREMIGTTRDSLNALNLLQRSIDALATALQSLIQNGGNK